MSKVKCQHPNDKGKLKSEDRKVISLCASLPLCLFASLRQKQRSAAQHRTMKHATNPKTFQKTSRPTRCCGPGILEPQDVPS
jgi:hypothetical protein